jgi:hypothetical protein
MKRLKQYILIGVMAAGIASCEKDGFTPLADYRPPVAVNVSNATEYRPGPTVTVSRVTNTFSIVLEVPAESGRTIKEITKIVATSGSSQPLFGTTGLYPGGPVAGNNTNKITFNTSLTQYAAQSGNSIPANNPPVNGVELAKQFYFLVTLDDNSTVITQQVRVLVVP